MKSRGPKSGRFLAIIDLNKIPQESLFTASDLDLHPTKANGDEIRYYSGGEYLVYGHISKEAIVSIISVEELAASPPKTPSDPDPFNIAFITTAWRRVATRKVIKDSGYMMLSFYAGYAVGQLVRLFSLLSHLDVAGKYRPYLIPWFWSKNIASTIRDLNERSVFC